ncbi:aminotransferase class IV [Maricaulis sp. CAU 1757]
MTGIVWQNGNWLPTGSAVWDADDRAALLGDGLFETIRMAAGAPVAFQLHMARLQRGCNELGLDLPYSEGELFVAARQLIKRNEMTEAALRLTVSAGPGPRGLARLPEPNVRVVMNLSERIAPPETVTLTVTPRRRSPDSLTARLKTLSYIDNVVARRDAKAQGADMALLLDTRGNLSGGDSANLFWVDHDRLYTPSLDCAVLPGTARARLIDEMPVTEGRFQPDALRRSPCVFVTNALMGAVMVGRLDDIRIGDGDPLFDRARDLLAAAD